MSGAAAIPTTSILTAAMVRLMLSVRVRLRLRFGLEIGLGFSVRVRVRTWYKLRCVEEERLNSGCRNSDL